MVKSDTPAKRAIHGDPTPIKMKKLDEEEERQLPTHLYVEPKSQRWRGCEIVKETKDKALVRDTTTKKEFWVYDDILQTYDNCISDTPFESSVQTYSINQSVAAQLRNVSDKKDGLPL